MIRSKQYYQHTFPFRFQNGLLLASVEFLRELEEATGGGSEVSSRAKARVTGVKALCICSPRLEGGGVEVERVRTGLRHRIKSLA